jgi:hypothetical protein
VNLSAADAIVQHGEHQLRPAVHRAAIDAYNHSPVPGLLQSVEALHKTLLAADPATLRRSVGWFGRLIGRDITLQAEAAALRRQLGVHARTADQQIADLRAYRDSLSQHLGALQSAATDLDAAADALGPITADQTEQGLAISQRQHHLRTVAQAYRLTAAHLQMTLLNQDQLLGHLALLLPRVQLLLEQDRMLRDSEHRQTALSAAHTATEAMRTLLHEPIPDLAAGEPASHRPAFHRSTP